MQGPDFSWSGTDFIIKDQQGTIYFKVDGKVWSSSYKMVLKDYYDVSVVKMAGNF
jgi:uncharacterized protein YxjI